MVKITFALSTGHRTDLREELKQSIAGQRPVCSWELIEESAQTTHRHQRLYFRAKGEIVVFLDEDTRLPDPLWMTRMISALDARPEISGCGGHYLDFVGAPHRAQVYNQFCRTWIVSHTKEHMRTHRLLGGCLVLRKDKIGPSLPAPRPSLTWGGEDAWLISQLSSLGHEFIYEPEVSVEHRANCNWWHWVRRAWLHGKAKSSNTLQAQTNSVQSRILFWLSNTPWNHWPPIALHFGILSVSHLIRRRDRSSRSDHLFLGDSSLREGKSPPTHN